MKNFKYIIAGFLFSCLSVLALTSCNDSNDAPEELSRLFRPILFTATVDGNNVNFSWLPISGASYSLEISRDSFLFQNDLQIFPLRKVSSYTVEELWSNTRYSARIKAISDNPAINDSEFQELTFVTGTENIFYAITNEQIGTESILISWIENRDVSKVIVSSPGNEDMIIELTDEDKAAAQKLIGGLQRNTTYTFRIYLGDRLRGTISATTL